MSCMLKMTATSALVHVVNGFASIHILGTPFNGDQYLNVHLTADADQWRDVLHGFDLCSDFPVNVYEDGKLIEYKMFEL